MANLLKGKFQGEAESANSNWWRNSGRESFMMKQRVLIGTGGESLRGKHDIQIYCSFDLSDSDNTKSRIENFIADIQLWMISQKLKLNDDKTEIIISYGSALVPLKNCIILYV